MKPEEKKREKRRGRGKGMEGDKSSGDNSDRLGTL
jgi:hypothetical protein